MIGNDLENLLKIVISIILSALGICGLIGYFYLSIGRLYRQQENRWWVGLLATILPLISLTLGILIWMLWNPLVRPAFWLLLFLSFIISLILGQSVTSPYEMADWWIKLSRWLQNRK